MSEGRPVRSSRRWDSGRVETFSDGVFAIAITLLVLDIHVPSDLHGLRHALAHEWPSYLAYATSFLTIGGVWIAHHSIYSALRYVDRPLMRMNLFLLMATAFLPFPTGILAEALRAPAETAQTAVVLYGVTALVIELLLVASMRHAASRPELRVSEPETSVSAAGGTPGAWPAGNDRRLRAGDRPRHLGAAGRCHGDLSGARRPRRIDRRR